MQWNIIMSGATLRITKNCTTFLHRKYFFHIANFVRDSFFSWYIRASVAPVFSTQRSSILRFFEKSTDFKTVKLTLTKVRKLFVPWKLYLSIFFSYAQLKTLSWRTTEHQEFHKTLLKLWLTQNMKKIHEVSH